MRQVAVISSGRPDLLKEEAAAEQNRRSSCGPAPLRSHGLYAPFLYLSLLLGRMPSSYILGFAIHSTSRRDDHHSILCI